MPEDSGHAKKAESKPTGATRKRSTIDFPYLDLDNAIEIAQAVRNMGGDSCEWKQLATKLNVSAEGGGFRMRLLTAKTFNLLTYERGTIQLSDLGIRAADPVTERRSRYDAFMAVGLFKQLFEKLDGQTLPPQAAIERMMEQIGVTAKSKERARQVFLRSAKQAGLFELSSDRLSTPPSVSTFRASPAAQAEPEPTAKRNGGHEPPSGLHPFIEGLLRTLPKPDGDWSFPDRAKWLQAAANIFDLIYLDPEKENGASSISIALKKGEAKSA